MDIILHFNSPHLIGGITIAVCYENPALGPTLVSYADRASVACLLLHLLSVFIMLDLLVVLRRDIHDRLIIVHIMQHG